MTDCWCPGEAADPIFGDRTDAEECIHAAVLNRNGLNGRNVNVVIVDRGLDTYAHPRRETVDIRHRHPDPGPSPANHAMMVARHIRKVAPQATIFDCALLPEHISHIGQFIVVAITAYVQMLADIAFWKLTGQRSAEWVFVNA